MTCFAGNDATLMRHRSVRHRRVRHRSMRHRSMRHRSMRHRSLFLLVCCLGVTLSLSAAKKRSAIELTNPLLGPKFAQWLVGPTARMASEKEIKAFLELRDDAAAAEFVTQFWDNRDPFPDTPGNLVKKSFDQRAAEADKKYSESLHAGRHTDRGTIWVLYGPPEETEYPPKKNSWDPDVEMWRYPKKAEPGLDGKRPSRSYSFAKQGELTTFWTPKYRPDIRDRMQNPDYRDPRRDPP